MLFACRGGAHLRGADPVDHPLLSQRVFRCERTYPGCFRLLARRTRGAVPGQTALAGKAEEV